jgi:multicomponent Na+:H+ antiporter subunit F
MTLPALYLILLLMAIMAGFYRLITGPTDTDRVIALDLLFAIAVVMCLCAAITSGSTAFLDVAIGLSLVGFVATIAWSRLIEQQLDERRKDR